MKPDGVLVSWATCPDSTNVRGTSCDLGHFFASPGSAGRYAAAHPTVTLFSVEEIHARLAPLVTAFVGDVGEPKLEE